MSLIKCPECGKEISSYATSCPHCGRPMRYTSISQKGNLSPEPIQKDNIICPKCGSSQISANKKGFSAGKAVAGAVVAGGIGLAAGGIGSDKVIITCLKCGHQFKPGIQPLKEQMPLTLGVFTVMVFIMLAILIPACGGSWWFLLIMPILGFISAFLIGIYKEHSGQSQYKNAKESAEVFKNMK